MKLNIKKTSSMIFKFTNNFQFNTKFNIEGDNIYIRKKTKILGLVITDNLKWEENTKEFIHKNIHIRMCLLKKVSSFKEARKD